MVGFLFAVLLCSWLLTGLVRHYALLRQVVDIPNVRSAHQTPTPRGGGVGMVLAIMAALGTAGGVGLFIQPGSMAILSASVWVAAVGFFDDHGYLNVSWRLLSHALAAVWLVMGLHCPPISLFGWVLSPGWVLHSLIFLYVVWMTNLYNFMDGLDGLAALEATCACIGAVLIYLASEHTDLQGLPLLLTASVLGFLLWNWPPARIFMGDAGSGFLGCMLAGISLQAAHVSSAFFWSWLILLGVFIVDATYTLLVRAMRFERLYQPHRLHAYQQAARRYHSHARVCLAVVLINVLWLWPLAALVGVGGYNGSLVLLLAYLPLMLIARAYKAGQPQ